MPRASHTSPHTRAVLTALLQLHPAYTHGYDLSKATALKSGTLYPILQRLHEQGHLEAEWENSPHSGKPPRHIYRLTAQGVALAREKTASRAAPELKGAWL